MKLFNFNKKRNSVEQKNSFDEPIDKLTPEGDLPIGWYYYNKSFLKPKDDEIVRLALASSPKAPLNDRIKFLEQLISFYYEYQKECYSKGECFRKYFEDNYNHCINSKNNDFVYIHQYEETLSELLENYDTLIEQEKRHNDQVQVLNQKLLDFIKSNEGVLQKDIYKRFDDSVKPDIKELLYFFDKEGIIIRVKTGNTYTIRLKE